MNELYVAYEQGEYDGLDFYGYFNSNKEAIIKLKKEIRKHYTKDSNYRFFRLKRNKIISTNLPVEEIKEIGRR